MWALDCRYNWLFCLFYHRYNLRVCIQLVEKVFVCFWNVYNIPKKKNNHMFLNFQFHQVLQLEASVFSRERHWMCFNIPQPTVCLNVQQTVAKTSQRVKWKHISSVKSLALNAKKHPQKTLSSPDEFSAAQASVLISLGAAITSSIFIFV